MPVAYELPPPQRIYVKAQNGIALSPVLISSHITRGVLGGIKSRRSSTALNGKELMDKLVVVLMCGI